MASGGGQEVVEHRMEESPIESQAYGNDGGSVRSEDTEHDISEVKRFGVD